MFIQTEQMPNCFIFELFILKIAELFLVTHNDSSFWKQIFES